MNTSFLRRIWTQQPTTKGAYYCVSTKEVSGKFRDHFFSTIDSAEKFVEDAIRANNAGARACNVYFAPNLFKLPRRIKENVLPSKLLFSDLDRINPSSCGCRPQVAWKSSSNRYAAIWVLKDSLAGEKFEELNRKVTYAVGADKSGWDSVQVLRLPGTLNFKYDPPQPSKIMWHENSRYYTPQQVLIKPETVRTLKQSSVMVGTRSDMLWRLECELKEQGLDDEQILEAVKKSEWNKYKGRRDEDTRLRIELKKIRAKHEAEAEEQIEYEDAICMEDVEPEEINWLWPPYFPQGKLVILEGDPGEGKSWFTLFLCSLISNGDDLVKGNQGKVLVLNAEDSKSDTLRPRLDVLKANNRNILVFEKPLSFDNLEDVDHLNWLLDKHRPLVTIIDPLVAYMSGHVDIAKANQTRQVMAQLKLSAERFGTCIVCVRHLTKSARERMIYRGLGSIDLTAAVRSQLMVGPMPDHEDEKVICQLKCSYLRMGKAMKYKITEKGQFVWLGECDFKPTDWEKKEEKPMKVTASHDKAPKDATPKGPKKKVRLSNGKLVISDT